MNSNEIFYNKEIVLVAEWAEEEGPFTCMGTRSLVIYRLYRDSEGQLWEDVITEAPWQIGGDSGQVRELTQVPEDYI